MGVRITPSRLIFLGISGAVLLLVGLAVMVRPLSVAAPQKDQPALQAAALRPDHISELNELDDIPEYTLSAMVDPESGRYTGEVEVNYTNPGPGDLNETVFRLYPNAGAIYGGGSLLVSEVWQGGEMLQMLPSPDPTILRIRLAQPLKMGDSVSLRLVFSGQVPAGNGQGYGIFRRSPGRLALAGWYPVLAVYSDGWQEPEIPMVGDALQAETSFYSANLTLPAAYRLASTGTVVSTSTVTATLPFQLPDPTATAIDGDTGAGLQASQPTMEARDWTTWQVVSGPAREFAAVAGIDFAVAESEWDGVKIRLFYRGADTGSVSPQRGLEMAEAVLASYEDRFGPYPYAELDVVENQITIDGYEFSGMVILDPDLRLSGNEANYEYLLAHEIAHQWWYGLAGNPTIIEPWLDEAHASYSAVLYLEDVGRSASGAGLLQGWQKMVSLVNAPAPVNSSALDFTNWNLYRDTVYLRGALFIDALRQEMGDEQFFELLHRYQDQFRYGLANTAEYLSLAEEVAGRDLSELFNTWFSQGLN